MHEVIDRTIENGNFASLVKLLEGVNTSELRYAAKKIALSSDGAESLFAKAQEWMIHPASASRHLACLLLLETYDRYPKPTLTHLLALADDPDRAVRETAGDTCGQLLRRDFQKMIGILTEWRKHSSENVRRAVINAAMKAAQNRRLEWVEPLLRLLEPLLADRNSIIRRSLGSVALGRAFLRYYPEMTFEYLIKWSTSSDEQVLWNVAMAFSSSSATPLAKKALIILRRLSLDERRYVWRAVASAMWKLGRKKPETIRPELARWLEDERRNKVAREALRYL
jgi:3-methyladenine DNA glycosylase AlkC